MPSEPVPADVRALPAIVLLVLAGCSEAPPPAGRESASRPARIVQFYISPSVIERGQQSLVCYGVENARAVRIDPPVEELKPAYNRCFAVSPERDTTYTLTAEGADGGAVSRSIGLEVRPPSPAARREETPPLILQLAASAEETAPGRPVTICYRAAPGASVRLEPEVAAFKPGEKACFSVAPRQTTTYTLSASAPGGRRDRQTITIRVR